MAVSRDLIMGCWARISGAQQPLSPSSVFMQISNGLTTVAQLKIEQLSSTGGSPPSPLSDSSWRARLTYSDGFTTVQSDSTDPYAEPFLGGYPTDARSGNTPHLWAMRIKMANTGSSDGEVEVFLDGVSIISATGIALPNPFSTDDVVFGYGINGDLDNAWAVASDSLPSMDSNGVLDSPGDALYYDEFNSGDRSAWTDWQILSPFTATPHMVSDAGAGGGYGVSRWTNSPSSSAYAGNVPYAGLKRTVSASADTTLRGTIVFGVSGTVTKGPSMLISMDGSSHTLGDEKTVEIWADNFRFNGDDVATGTATGTVTHTGGALTSNHVIVGAGTDDIAVLGSAGTTTTVLHGNASGAPSFGAVVEGDLSLSDNTTANVSTSAHGFAPKAPNNTTQFLRADATWATPGNAGVGGDAIAYKSTDQTINSNTTLQNDSALLFSLDASSVYEFELRAYLLAPNNTTDWKIQFTVPASATLLWAPQINSGFSAYWGTEGTTLNPVALRDQSSATLNIASISTTHGLVIWGLVTTAGTSGNLQFQWAQNTSDAGNSTVKAGSRIKYRKLA